MKKMLVEMGSARRGKRSIEVDHEVDTYVDYQKVGPFDDKRKMMGPDMDTKGVLPRNLHKELPIIEVEDEGIEAPIDPDDVD